MLLSLNPQFNFTEEQSDDIASRSSAFTFMRSVALVYV